MQHVLVQPDNPAAVEQQKIRVLAELLIGKKVRQQKEEKAKLPPLLGEDAMLSAHLKYIEAQGCTPKHLGQVKLRVERVFGAAKIRKWSDISVFKVITAVGSLRRLPPKHKKHRSPASEESGRPISDQHRNHHLQATKTF